MSPTPRKMTGALAAALAAAALATPTAGAMPVDGPIHHARDHGTNPAMSLREWEFKHHIATPQPQPQRPVSVVAPADDGTPWVAIVIGAAGASLLVGAAGGVAGSRRLRM